MKRTWTQPVAKVQHFEANEYIASTCGDKEVEYKFVCNAISDSWFQSGGSVWREDNGLDGLQTGYEYHNGRLYEPDTKMASMVMGYKPCGKDHVITQWDFDNNIKPGYLYTLTGGTKDILIWSDKGRNVHCTANINKNEWEVLKS